VFGPLDSAGEWSSSGTIDAAMSIILVFAVLKVLSPLVGAGFLIVCLVNGFNTPRLLATVAGALGFFVFRMLENWAARMCKKGIEIQFEHEIKKRFGSGQ
jgi:predicted membrane metal-binding protein